MLRSSIPLTATFFLVLVLGCSKKSDTNLQPAYYVKAKVGGSDFFYDATLDKKNQQVYYSGTYKLFSFTVTPKDKESLQINCVLTQNQKPETADIVATGYQTGPDFYSAAGATKANGKCSISKVDDKMVEGTFYFDAYKANDGTKISVTDGQFRLQYY